MNKIDKTIQHIVELQYKLCQVENNLQYIGLMVSLKKSLEKFYGLFKNEKEQQGQYLSTYHYYFMMVVVTLFMIELATPLLNIGMANVRSDNVH